MEPTTAILQSVPLTVVRLRLEPAAVSLAPLLEQRNNSSLCHLVMYTAADISAEVHTSEIVQLTATDPHKFWTLEVAAEGHYLAEIAQHLLDLLQKSNGKSSLTDLTLKGDEEMGVWPEVISIDRSLHSLRMLFEVSASAICNSSLLLRVGFDLFLTPLMCV